MATVEHAVKETLVAPWEEWARREIRAAACWRPVRTR